MRRAPFLLLVASFFSICLQRSCPKQRWRRGLTNITFRQCTAESVPFPDNSFDRVVSRLGAMFFPNEAFADILRVTKPDGRVGLEAALQNAARLVNKIKKFNRGGRRRL